MYFSYFLISSRLVFHTFMKMTA